MKCRFEWVEDACAVYALSYVLYGLLLLADALGLRCLSVSGSGGLFEVFSRVKKGCVFSGLWF